MEDLIAEEEVVLTISRGGYAKRTPLSVYRAQRRGGKGRTGAATAAEDVVEHLFVGSTHDSLLAFTNKGRVHWVKVYDLPSLAPGDARQGPRELPRPRGGGALAAMATTRTFPDDRFLLFATKNGTVKKTVLSAYGNPREKGIIAIKLEEGDELLSAQITDGTRKVFLGTRNGMGIKFDGDGRAAMGRDTTGVKGIELREGDVLVEMDLVEESVDAPRGHGEGLRQADGRRGVPPAGPGRHGRHQREGHGEERPRRRRLVRHGHGPPPPHHGAGDPHPHRGRPTCARPAARRWASSSSTSRRGTASSRSRSSRARTCRDGEAEPSADARARGRARTAAEPASGLDSAPHALLPRHRRRRRGAPRPRMGPPGRDPAPARRRRTRPAGTRAGVLAELAQVGDGPVVATLAAGDPKAMYKEARELHKHGKNVVLRVPMTREGLRVVRLLGDEQIATDVGLVFTATQALLAARAGSAYVSPSVGELDDAGQIGMDVVESIVRVYDNYGLETQICVQGIQNPIHVLDAAALGADVADAAVLRPRQALRPSAHGARASRSCALPPARARGRIH